MSTVDPDDRIRTLEISLPKEWWGILDRLVAAHPYCNTMEDFVTELLDHVQQGVYRSGSWERGWLEQCVPFEAINAAYDATDDPRNFRLGEP